MEKAQTGTPMLEVLKKQAIEDGGYYVVATTPPTKEDAMALVRYCLGGIPEKSDFTIYCSKKTRIQLLEWFLMDDFNYLGTRIIIESSEAFDRIFPDQFTALAMSGGKPIGWLETQ